MENIYKKAAQFGLRYNFRGQITTEDLFNLSVEQLDGIFKELNKRHKEMSQESLIETKSTTDYTLELQIEIIKDIVKDKLQEQREALMASAKKAEREKIMDILKTKQDQELHNLSTEELEAKLLELS